MNPQQQHATLTIALLAAFADGANDDRECEPIRHVADTLGGESGTLGFAPRYREDLLNHVDPEAVAAALNDPEHRQLAYKMAVRGSADDGRMTEQERPFLEISPRHLVSTLGHSLGMKYRISDTWLFAENPFISRAF